MALDLKEAREYIGDSLLTDDELERLVEYLEAIASNLVERNLTQCDSDD